MGENRSEDIHGRININNILGLIRNVLPVKVAHFFLSDTLKLKNNHYLCHKNAKEDSNYQSPAIAHSMW